MHALTWTRGRAALRCSVDPDERRRIENLIEMVRRETERLKLQVEATRELHARSRKRFLEAEALFRQRRLRSLPPDPESDPDLDA